MAGGVILGLLVGGVIVGLIIGANWVADALHHNLQNIAMTILLAAIAIVAFLVWLTHEPLRQKKP
jgi:fucose permease